MDKTEIVKRVQDLSTQLRQAKAELDKYNADARIEYEKKKYEDFIFSAKAYDVIKQEDMPITRQGTDASGFTVGRFGFVEYFQEYYGGGGSFPVAKTVEEAKKRVFFEKVANIIVKVNEAAARDKQQNKEAPYIALDLDNIITHLFKAFSEASLNGVFDNEKFEETVLEKT